MILGMASNFASTQPRRLPQELCDLVISHVPEQDLPQCTLVCKDWVRSSSRRLLSDIACPLEPPVRRSKVVENCFTEFLATLSTSPRLQDAIRTLRLGRNLQSAPSLTNTPVPYVMCISALISIIRLCPRLDHLALADLRLYPAPNTSESAPVQFGSLNILSLTDCSMRGRPEMRCILDLLLSFKRIETLQVRLRACTASNRNIAEKSTPLQRSVDLKSISWSVSNYVSQPDIISLNLLNHLGAIADLHTNISSVTAGVVSQAIFAHLQHMNSLETLTYYVYSHRVLPTCNLSSLRRLTIHIECSTDWPCIMQDLAGISCHSKLEYVGICMADRCHSLRGTAGTEETALSWFQHKLTAHNWEPLESLVERCPSVKVELLLPCTYFRSPRTRARTRTSAQIDQVDPNRIVLAARELVVEHLSERVRRVMSIARHVPPDY